MECKYYLNVDGTHTTFNSDKELSEFIKSRINFKKDDILNKKIPFVKFSLETKQAATLKSIDAITSKDALMDEYNFVHSEHIIDGTSQLLAPYFSFQNYLSAILNNIKEKLPEGNPKYSKYIGLSDDEIVGLIKKEDVEDNNMKSISGIITNIITDLSIGNNVDNKIDSLIKSIIIYNGDSEIGYDIPRLTKELFIKFNEYISDLKRSGELRSNVKISELSENPKVKTKTHLLRIGSSGIPEIFHIKTSRSEYEDWHTAKRLETDYILGIKRQIMGSYVNTDESPLFILPVIIPEINGKLDLNKLNIEKPIDRSTSPGLNMRNGEITKKLQKLLPSIFIREKIKNSNLDADNAEVLELMFKKYDFKTQMKSKDVDELISDAKEFCKDKEEIYIYDRLSGGGKKISSPNTSEGLKSFRKKVEEYVEEYNLAKNDRLYKLVKDIVNSKNNHTGTIVTNDRYQAVELDIMFGKYLNDD